MAGSFDLKKAVDGRFYFNLKAGNGEIILTSQMYTAKASAQDGIAAVQVNSPLAERYSPEGAKDGEYYFTLKAANHLVIGTSEMYTTEEMRDKGIASAMKNGGTTAVHDHA